MEYSADVVICLWRDKAESEKLTKDFERKTDRIEAHVLKNRNGELAKVKLNFTKAWALFTDEGKGDLDYDAAPGNDVGMWAALLGPSLTVPLIAGRLVLGTWQQIVLADFDNEPRDRKLLVSISGY